MRWGVVAATSGKQQANESFDQRIAVESVLLALEVKSSSKRDPLLSELLRAYAIGPDLGLAELVDAIFTGPGFKRFFIDVATAARPFSRMVLEVYGFLSRHAATVDRRASRFLVSFATASEAFDFDLTSFPTEKFRLIAERPVIRQVVEMRQPNSDPDVELEELWKSANLIWDADFYDDGFGRALTFAPAIAARSDAAAWQPVAELVDPIVDRIAAIVEHAEALGPGGLSPDPVTSYMNIEWEGLHLPPAEARAFEVRAPDGDATTIPGQNAIWGFAMAVMIWRERVIRRVDRDDWLADKSGRPLDLITAEEYLRLIEPLARSFTAALDLVAPIVDTRTSYESVEQIVDFLSLPFWKQRWFLYELWTLATVLSTAESVAPVALEGIRLDDVGRLTWALPGGDAQAPVGYIGSAGRRLACWSQRKTYHPKTKKGLEPDLRISRASPTFHDVFIVENKDRASLGLGELREIVDRYVGGTCAQHVWFVNFKSFPASTAQLVKAWPDRVVRVASEFRPGSTPPDFATSLREVVASEVGTAPSEYRPGGSTGDSGPGRFSATLAWASPPGDLDLHAWISRGGVVSHVDFASTGRLDAEPFALLDHNSQAGGSETIAFAEPPFEWAAICVDAYVEGETPAGSGAVVEFRGLGVGLLRVEAPSSGAGRCWSVGVIFGNGEWVDLTSEVGDGPRLPVSGPSSS